MDTVRTVADLRARVAVWRAGGLRVALVPTMGALHDGHLSLVRLGRRHADRIVATIFVNPTQFGPTEDLGAYPRDEDADAAMLAAEGCDLLYAPEVATMYPPGFATAIRVGGGLTDVLCGAARPGHFDGVALVVAKYLIQAQADVAVFGEKDWQQLALIRRLAADLDIPTEIVGGPIARAPDGIALSSRNRYLTDAERAAAPNLFAALMAAAAAITQGAPIDESLSTARAQLSLAGFGPVDYVEARDAQTLAPVSTRDPARAIRLFGAARLGRARLIDNVPVA